MKEIISCSNEYTFSDCELEKIQEIISSNDDEFLQSLLDKSQANDYPESRSKSEQIEKYLDWNQGISLFYCEIQRLNFT